MVCESPIHLTPARPDQVVLHYRRPNADYNGWGLYFWGSVSRNGVSWEASLPPAGQDSFGVYWVIDIQPNAAVLNYIIHAGSQKDPGPDQTLNLNTHGREVWLVQDSSEQFSDPAAALTGSEDHGLGDIKNKAEAHWLAVDSLAWPVNLPLQAVYQLQYDPVGAIRLSPSGLEGGRSLPLEPVAAHLPPFLAKRFPYLAQSIYLRLQAVYHHLAPEILKGQLVVTAADSDGRLLRAAGLQIPGVLDDLYASHAAGTVLGVDWTGDQPALRVWAPTARSVRLHLHPSAAAPNPTEYSMTLDRLSGVWSISGSPEWEWQFYHYEVEVYIRQIGRVVCNSVTDPYSLSLSTNSTLSQIVRLDSPALQPPGWQELVQLPLAHPCDSVLYELHLRDFSSVDQTVPEQHRGTYLAFTHPHSSGMRHLRRLAQAGLTHLHLLPVFDIATIDEDKSRWLKLNFDQLASYPSDSERQQAAVETVRGKDGYNWGYDPYHYTTPEGGYAVNPAGSARIFEFRQMVMALNAIGLRLVMDVVYNHTHAAGLGDQSVFDKIVPGYYHRLDAAGRVITSSCCANIATEHAMMEKLMLDSLATWARAYKIAGFRFDLMGHHMVANIIKVRAALDALTLAQDGVDGSTMILYGEGWDFGEVANNARGINASQINLAGLGIGAFNDRFRDAVRGGSPFAGLHDQGFITGLYTDPNPSAGPDPAAQRTALLALKDRLCIGLAGGLAEYRLRSAQGTLVRGASLDYNGASVGYAQMPQENVVYISAHDNETLFDIIQLKSPPHAAIAERVRMHNLGLSLVALSQGLPFFDAGIELLRSKSLDRDSFDSGDWFNRIDWSGASNNWGIGLPLKDKNGARWPVIRPLLANPALKPSPAHLQQSFAHFIEMLAIRRSSPLFRLRSAAEIKAQLHFLNTGPDQLPGLIVMVLSSSSLDEIGPADELIIVLFNADRQPLLYSPAELLAANVALHPLQAASADPQVRTARFDPASRIFTIPARTTAVFIGSGRLQLTF